MSYEPLQKLYQGIADVYNSLRDLFVEKEEVICVHFKYPTKLVTSVFQREFNRLKEGGTSLKPKKTDLESRLPPNSQ